MSRDEAKKIVMIIASTYPTFKPNNMSMVVDSWHYFLADYEYNDIAIALKTFVNTSGKGFAPSVDQIIAMTRKPMEIMQMTEQEAWACVSRAIRNSSYHSEEEFEKLPDLCKKVVQSPSQLKAWASSDEDSIESVVASNFQRSYRTAVERQKEYNYLPTEAKAKLEHFQRIALEGS